LDSKRKMHFEICCKIGDKNQIENNGSVLFLS